MDEYREQTGSCMFCGQNRIIEMSEDEWLDRIQKTNRSGKTIADYMASRECSCRDGMEWRAEQESMEQAVQNIEILFGEKYPEVADILTNAVELIGGKKIKRITVMTPEKYQATMEKKRASIRIHFKEVNETEMTT